jgi:hypothetical protein
VYSSATGISSVEGMGYLTRLGLWGVNTSFASYKEFVDVIGSGKSGVSALEMLALDFKSTGFQVARNVGYAGAEFNVISARLQRADAEQYRGACELWQDVRLQLVKVRVRDGARGVAHVPQAFELAEAGVNSAPGREYAGMGRMTSSERTQATKLYWSGHQRFFKQLCMTLKVPALVEEARVALQNNMCVVVGLQTTGEAAIGRARVEASRAAKSRPGSDEEEDLDDGQLLGDELDDLLVEDEVVEHGEGEAGKGRARAAAAAATGQKVGASPAPRAAPRTNDACCAAVLEAPRALGPRHGRAA